MEIERERHEEKKGRQKGRIHDERNKEEACMKKNMGRNENGENNR